MKVGALDQRIHELEEQLDGNALGLGAEGPRCEIGDEAADFTIRCKDMEWKVHQAVLSKCDFFKACFRNEFKEAQEGTMTFEEDDPESVDVLIRYLYTGDPSIIHRHSLRVEAVFERNINAFIIANKYCVTNLKAKALEYIRYEIALVEENLGSTDDRSQARLTALVETLRAMYDEDSDQVVLEDVKNEMVETIAALPKLWSECQNQGLDALMEEVPAFRRHLLRDIARVMARERQENQDLHTWNHKLQLAVPDDV